MTRTFKMLLAVALVVSGAFGSAGIARAQVNNSSGDNVQSGDNRSSARQSGSSKSGAAVGGQVVGVVSSGATSVDARNTSDNVDVTSGEANGTNHLSTFTGLNDSGRTSVGNGVAAELNGPTFADNVQDGDNRSTFSQSATASSGDGVGGQVIGVVTAAGGSASVVAANTTRDTSIDTGDATAKNNASAFVGENTNDPLLLRLCLISSQICADNVQSGDNRLTGNQSATAHTGDGVGGQVIGVVSAGRTSVDASNTTTDSDIKTGDATAQNNAAEFVGLNDSDTITVGGGIHASELTGVNAENVQDGDNNRTINQTADASSGDAVAGQVSGVVTSAGGSASVVVANTSTNIDATSGTSTFHNDDAGFVGLNEGFGPITVL